MVEFGGQRASLSWTMQIGMHDQRLAAASHGPAINVLEV